MGQIFELKIEASGEVRDAAGNLIETVPIEQTLQVTEDEMRELLAEHQLPNAEPGESQ